MDKSLISEIKCIIDEIEGYDYISKVKYVILLICNELYNSINENPMKSTAIFKEYAKFDLENFMTEERIAELMGINAGNIEIQASILPPCMKLCLLTRKILGQVYTPFEIINICCMKCLRLKI